MNTKPRQNAASDIAPPLPHSLEAERAVLGGLLLNGSALDAVIDTLKPDDFFLPQNVRIFSCMTELRKRHAPVDTVTVVDYLQRAGELEAAGGAAYVSALPDGLPHITHVEHYAQIVRDDAGRRLAIHRAEAIVQAAFDHEDIAEINRRFSETADLIRPAQECIPVISAKAFCALKLKSSAYLIDGIIKDPSMNELFSWRGVGKTMFGLALAHAVSSGSKFLKWQAPKATGVLYVDGELNSADLQQRLSFLGATENENLKLLCSDMLEDPFPHLATARAQRIIEDRLGSARLLLLDNLSALAPSSNEEEAAHWILIQTWLKELKRQGISSKFLHHAGHAGWARGTTRREDLLDVVIELRRPKDYVASEGLRFEVHFTKTRGMLGHLAEPLEASLTTSLDGDCLWTYRDLEDARLAQVVTLKTAGKTWREIEQETGVPKSTAQRLWNNTTASKSE